MGLPALTVFSVRPIASASSCGHETFEVDVRGAHIDVLWDGKVVLSAEDETFTRGAIGVWTKADSYVLFDDLVLDVD